jgi:mRNA interferase MazF
MKPKQLIYVIAWPPSQRIGIVQKWIRMMPFSRGDVVLVLFPDSNLRTAKRRPALVVQADNLQTGLAQTIVAMISSNMARGGPACRVVVQNASLEGRQMGLHSDSVIMTDNLATILETEIDRAIGKCPYCPLLTQRCELLWDSDVLNL